MKVKKILILLIVMVGLSGCYIGPASYEVFVSNRNLNIGDSFIPIMNPKLRQIYDENRYIYIFEHIIEGCVYGYLTNRDDKPEVVQEWIILSGKENCKITESFVLIQ